VRKSNIRRPKNSMHREGKKKGKNGKLFLFSEHHSEKTRHVTRIPEHGLGTGGRKGSGKSHSPELDQPKTELKRKEEWRNEKVTLNVQKNILLPDLGRGEIRKSGEAWSWIDIENRC